MKTIVRKATSADAEALATLLRNLGTIKHVNAETPEATGLRVAEHLNMCLADQSHLVLIAEDQTRRVAGYLAIHWLPYLILRGPEGYVSELFVAADSRGQGIGSRLLDAAVQEAKARGCARLMLLNMRDRESYKREFYRKHAWEEREDAANFVLQLR
jgi:GNAT superfamily N-acetyltransferase